MDPEEALFRATLAGARAMGRGAVAGSLDPERRADFVLMPRGARAQSPQAWFEDLLEGSPDELEQRPLGTWIAGHQVSTGSRRIPLEPTLPC